MMAHEDHSHDPSSGEGGKHDQGKLREDYTVKMKKMKEVVAVAIMSIARIAH